MIWIVAENYYLSSNNISLIYFHSILSLSLLTFSLSLQFFSNSSQMNMSWGWEKKNFGLGTWCDRLPPLFFLHFFHPPSLSSPSRFFILPPQIIISWAIISFDLLSVSFSLPLFKVIRHTNWKTGRKEEREKERGREKVWGRNLTFLVNWILQVFSSLPFFEKFIFFLPQNLWFWFSFFSLSLFSFYSLSFLFLLLPHLEIFCSKLSPAREKFFPFFGYTLRNREGEREREEEK